MCTNKRWIRNPYNGQQYFVNCGHCESCMREKTNNVFKRIINTFGYDYDVFFVTLTYQNCFIPYVRKSDFGVYPLPIYRDSEVKKIRYTTEYDFKKHVVTKPHVISSIETEDFDNFLSLPSLQKYDADKVGVCYYKDLQNYLKRFRQILLRNYGFQKRFLYFSCSEYGRKTSRPHFHLLLFFPKGFADVAKAAHFKAWSFDSDDRKKESFEIARKPAKYVSGYLQKSLFLHDFFKTKFIRQKRSYSQGFGATPKYLHLDSLLQKIDRGNITCDVQYTDKNGCPVILNILFPRYIANRYFPRFKGDFQFNASALARFIKSPREFAKKYNVDYTYDELRSLTIRFRNCYSRFCELEQWKFDFSTYRYYKQKFTLDDYIRYYIKFWKLYYSTLYKKQFDNIESFDEYYQLYDNFSQVQKGFIKSDWKLLYKGYNLELDPNQYPINVYRTNKFIQDFYEYDKKEYIIDDLCTLHNVSSY